jgi:hypothetical protein
MDVLMTTCSTWRVSSRLRCTASQGLIAPSNWYSAFEHETASTPVLAQGSIQRSAVAAAGKGAEVDLDFRSVDLLKVLKCFTGLPCVREALQRASLLGLI